MGGVCTYQLADIIVLFCTLKSASIDGTYEMLNKFVSADVQRLRPERPIYSLVAARVEDRGKISASR